MIKVDVCSFSVLGLDWDLSPWNSNDLIWVELLSSINPVYNFLVDLPSICFLDGFLKLKSMPAITGGLRISF